MSDSPFVNPAESRYIKLHDVIVQAAVGYSRHRKMTYRKAASAAYNAIINKEVAYNDNVKRFSFREIAGILAQGKQTKTSSDEHTAEMKHYRRVSNHASVVAFTRYAQANHNITISEKSACWKCGEDTDNKVLCCNAAFCKDCHYGVFLRTVCCVECGKRIKEDKAFMSKTNPYLSPSLILYKHGKLPDYKLKDDKWYDELDEKERQKEDSD